MPIGIAMALPLPLALAGIANGQALPFSSDINWCSDHRHRHRHLYDR